MICYGCGGSGSRTETRQLQCDCCRGTRTVEQWQQPSNTSRDCWGPPGRVMCSKCAGRGTLERQAFVECPECRGSGKRKEAAGIQGSSDWQSPPRTQARPEPRPMRQPNTGFTEALSQLIVWAALAWGVWWVFGWLKRLIT